MVGSQCDDDLSVRLLNYTDRFARAGKSVIHVMVESDWICWNDLHNIGGDYNVEKRQLLAEVLDRGDGPYPALHS